MASADGTGKVTTVATEAADAPWSVSLWFSVLAEAGLAGGVSVHGIAGLHHGEVGDNSLDSTTVDTPAPPAFGPTTVGTAGAAATRLCLGDFGSITVGVKLYSDSAPESLLLGLTDTSLTPAFTKHCKNEHCFGTRRNTCWKLLIS